MAHEIKLPEIAENVESATVIEVMVSPGDTVEKDQALIEIETEKAATEVPADVAGTIEEVFVNEGDEIKVGDKMVSIKEGGGGEDKQEEQKEEEEEEGEEKKKEQKTEDKKEKEPESKEKKTEEKTEEKPEEEKQEKKEKPDKEAKEKEEPEEEEEETGSKEGKKQKDREIQPVPASPAVRRFAREIGVDIHSIRGNGPGGRISMDDVKQAAREGAAGGGREGISLPDFSRFGNTRRKPMGRVKEITAENTTASWQNIPQVTHFDEADVTDLETFRKKYGDLVKKAGGKLTVTAIIVKIMAEALKMFPSFNASLDIAKKEIIYKDYINIGVAVDTSRGLLVPVIRDADTKSLTRLAVELTELAEKARNKKISPDEMKGGNFTVSNLGGIGGTGFTPVIFPPQSAILAVSRAKTAPVFMDGEFVPRMILPLGVTYDHRIIDGAEGAAFLRWTCAALENPLAMYLEGGN
ncbi:MAG: 2-oxo acid dehydrogenase subunit E2 [Spirochaetia bacterium]